MRKSAKAILFGSLATMLLIWTNFPVFSEDKPADNMEVVREKIKADKKLLVATNMELTESEAGRFWPVYEAYQTDLGVINQRIGNLIGAYAADYRAGTFSDEKASALVEEMVAIGMAEAELQASYVPRLREVLPMRKVARYLQIENKIRAVVKYDLASQVPLMP